MPTPPEDASSDVRIWLKPFGLGIMYLLFGGFVFCHALFDQWTYSEILKHGEIATAEVFNMKNTNSDYSAKLAWLDKSGLLRTYQTSLSAEFVRSINQGGHATRLDTPIKYLQENSYGRPLVIGDERERERIVSNDIRWGLGLFLSSIALIVLLYVLRRRLAGKKPAVAGAIAGLIVPIGLISDFPKLT
jgi:hypothetical protein